MKKLPALLVAVLFIMGALAQDDNQFDKKFRLGLRINPQPTWFTAKSNNNLPNGVKFGFGFGLNVEYKLSSVAAILTGIGGDFERAGYNFRNDGSGNYRVSYFIDASGAPVEIKNGAVANYRKSGISVYELKNRTVNSTFLTIPAIIKLSTKTYDNSMKYFGLFGLEVAARTKAQAADSYYLVRKFTNDSSYTEEPAKSQTLNIGRDASLIPLRVGFNTGAGIEYNLGGTTYFLAGISFFHSFTNFSRKESRYLFSNANDFYLVSKNGSINFTPVEQKFFLNAIRINLGFMF